MITTVKPSGTGAVVTRVAKTPLEIRAVSVLVNPHGDYMITMVGVLRGDPRVYYLRALL